MSEEIVELNKIIEYKNICKKCGAENTLYPYFIGRKTVRFCENCKQVSTGITKSKYQEMKESIWIEWKSFRYFGYEVFDIKQGKIDKDYFEFKLKKPNGLILYRYRTYRNITSFRECVKSDIKTGEFDGEVD